MYLHLFMLKRQTFIWCCCNILTGLNTIHLKMEISDIPILGNTIDKTQVPPIHKKRILAFVNHFIISTCSFLNEFAVNCENKFIDVERKLQRVEASLIIIEEKLSSIHGVTETNKTDTNDNQAVQNTENVSNDSGNQLNNNEEQIETNPTEIVENTPEEEVTAGVKASCDARYKKYFKMVQFGVPINAVKMKMVSEGLDSNILDNPNEVLADGIPCEVPS